MSQPNWGHISNGATFEALARTLLFFEDAEAVLFGRSGKDGGQDIRSGDRTTVFQAKYHQDSSASKAIADAKKEAAKIANYQKPENSRYGQWSGVKNWCLVTNCDFNPTDDETWQNDVVPLFNALGLKASYRAKAGIEARLVEYPEVRRCFFDNQIRVLVTLNEAKDRIKDEQPFLDREVEKTYGRETELSEYRSFLNDPELKFCVIHGAGGTGKTRLMYQGGLDVESDTDWTVYWANTVSMSRTAEWFTSIVPERKTVLLIDEPKDESLLQMLSEQLGGRISNWKIVVSVRSPNDPVLGFLKSPKLRRRMKEIRLAGLPDEDARAVCLDLLESGPLSSKASDWKEDAANRLAKLFSNYPIWLTLAVSSLEKHGHLGDVPETAEGLADEYLQEVFTLQSFLPGEQLKQTLRWVALLGVVNREDALAMSVVGHMVKLDLSKLKLTLKQLVDRKVLLQRGAFERLVEIKPDVIRDHLLRQWLVINQGYGKHPHQPSTEFLELAEQIVVSVTEPGLGAVLKSMLEALGRTELLFRLMEEEVSLLSYVFCKFEGLIPQMAADSRVEVAGILNNCSAFVPEMATRVCRVLRTSPCDDVKVKGLSGSYGVSHRDVVLELGWLLYHAAMGASAEQVRSEIVREFIEVATLEAGYSRQGQVLPRDGKRALDLLPRIFNEAGSEFGLIVSEAVGRELMNSGVRTNASVDVLSALLKTLLSVERRDTDFVDGRVRIRNWLIQPNSSGWEPLSQTLANLKLCLLEANTSADLRVALWTTLTHYHSSLLRARHRVPSQFSESWDAQILANLEWIEEWLGAGTRALPELSLARNIWELHLRFGPSSGDWYERASKLEEIFQSNALAKEFSDLEEGRDFKTWGIRLQAKARELAEDLNVSAIEDFLDRASGFYGQDLPVNVLLTLGWWIGYLGSENQAVGSFLRQNLNSAGLRDWKSDFTATLAKGLVYGTRAQRSPANGLDLLKEFVTECGDSNRKVHLVSTCYGGTPPPSALKDGATLTTDEIQYVRSFAGDYYEVGEELRFITDVAWAIHCNWLELRGLLEATLERLPMKIVEATDCLINAIFWGVEITEISQFPPGLADWLLSQCLRMPDFDSLSQNTMWRLERAVEKLGGVDLGWLAEALEKRSVLEANPDAKQRIWALSHSMRLKAFVKKTNEHAGYERGAAMSLVRMVATGKGTVGFNLPGVIQELDPKGETFPRLVKEMVEQGVQKEELMSLSRVAGAYKAGSESWRYIAESILSKTTGLSGSDMSSIYHGLDDRGIRDYSGPYGAVSDFFYEEVADAQRYLDEEVDENLRKFWFWKLENSKETLEREIQNAKEKRGE